LNDANIKDTRDGGAKDHAKPRILKIHTKSLNSVTYQFLEILSTGIIN
jgi:hypothetical protein